MIPEAPTEFDFNWFSDDVARRLSAGQSVSENEYVAQFPGHEAEIREAFPVLCLLAEQDPPVEISGPDQINGYQIVREIGRGGMGIVYEATHPKLSRRMAIKVLTAAQAGKARLQERFAREAEAASRLSHPHIVPLFDFGEADERSYLVMPFIAGRGLDDILNQHWQRQQDASTEQSPPPAVGRRISADAFVARDFRRVAALGASIASALAHAHEQHTIHRDIKPANLLLDENRKVWVTDFGLAKLRDDNQDLSLSGDIIGTPRYMAPEQIRGQSDERSDIYSLGVTLWELASGARAWHTVDKGEMLTVKSSFDLPPVAEVNPDVPSVLAHIIGRCCAFRPKDRYQSAADVQQALNRFAHDGSSADRRFMSRESLGRAATSVPLFATMVACLLALSALLIYTHTPDSPALPPTPTGSRTSTRLSPGQPPAICGPTTLRPVIMTGQTSFADVHLTAIDPDGDRFSWQLMAGPDAHGFLVQRLTGHVCVRRPEWIRDSRQPHWNLSVMATDLQQPQLTLLTTDRNGRIHTADPLSVNGAAETGHSVPHGPTGLPGQLLGIWTNDGQTYFHTHLSNDGTVALYESQRDGLLWNATLLQADTGLLPTICGLTQHDRDYLCVRQTREGFVLEWLQKTAEHQFRSLGPPLPLPLPGQQQRQQPVGLSCLGDCDFQLILQTENTATAQAEYRLLELAVDRDRVLGLREVKRGYVPAERLSGLCGWLSEHSTAERARRDHTGSIVSVQIQAQQ